MRLGLRRVLRSAVLPAVASMLAALTNSGAMAAPRDHLVVQQAPVRSPIQETLLGVWADATQTWTAVLGGQIIQSDPPQINFVPSVQASHCYGLYISAGPVYCSGNATVFVSVASMDDLARKIPAMGDAGLAFLVAHEFGHHIQKITGRFRVLNAMLRADPRLQRELILRFELEADCLAGVWARNSKHHAAAPDARAPMFASLDAIGDDKLGASNGKPVDSETFTHGTSAQRLHWFQTGIDAGSADACKVLEAVDLKR